MIGGHSIRFCFAHALPDYSNQITIVQNTRLYSTTHRVKCQVGRQLDVTRVCKVFVQVMNWKDVYSFTKKWYPFLINYEHKL